jgi:hypothetical protein
MPIDAVTHPKAISQRTKAKPRGVAVVKLKNKGARIDKGIPNRPKSSIHIDRLSSFSRPLRARRIRDGA